MVKSLEEFILQENVKRLDEISLSRILHHDENTEFGTLSAERPNKTPEQNHKDNKELETSLRSHGYGVSHLNGTWKNDDGTVSGEHSLMVMARPQHKPGELLNHLKQYGAKYNQEAILHKAPGEEAQLHTLTTGEKFGLGKLHFNRDSDNKSSPRNDASHRHFAYQQDKDVK
jgi:hypothetical protein